MTRKVKTENVLPPPPLTHSIPLAFAAPAPGGVTATRVTTTTRTLAPSWSRCSLRNTAAAAASSLYHLSNFSFTLALHLDDNALVHARAYPPSRRCCSVVLQFIDLAALVFIHERSTSCLGSLGRSMHGFPRLRLACLPTVEGTFTLPGCGASLGVIFFSLLL